MAEAVQQPSGYGPGDDDRSAQEKLAAIVARLEKEVEDRINKKSTLELRWLKDLRQFHGEYEEELLSDLKAAGKSTLFINETRPKTNACEARLSDMLFPTDDKNWGIEPTPVPELTVEAERAAMDAAELRQSAGQNPDNPDMQAQAEEAESVSREIQARLEEARSRSRYMEEEIDDHLRQCQYGARSREVIRDGCKLGTGIMKGPVIGDRVRKSWQLDPESGEWLMQEIEDTRPVFWRVDPWHWFPDMDATSMEDCEGTFERHLMNKKELRRLARQPGMNEMAIRRVLSLEPEKSAPTVITDLRSITGTYDDSSITDRYHVYEYHGPLMTEELEIIASVMGQPEILDDVGEVDPLTEIEVTMWFCQNQLFKFGIHHLDSGESIYSVFCLEKDEASIFGFGIPYLMRDSQSSLGAAWRTMMDNAGLSSGPQIVINEDVIIPVNGKWVMEPRKLWKRKQGAPQDARAFETFDIPMHQAELANIVEMSKQHIDDETSISQIAEGEQGTHTTQTAHGMNILMNAVNVVFRRIVKNWDDDVTTPNIRRMYDFLMQFSPKEHIKGDYDVEARGTSVLLVREMQSANLMTFLLQFGGHPMLGQFLKEGGLPAMRRLVQTMMLPADELIKTNEELADDQAKAAENPQPDPEIMKLENELNITKMKGDYDIAIEEIKRDTAMMQLAQNSNLKLEDIKASLAGKRMEIDSKERIFASEAAIEKQMAKDNQEGSGSGGYFSAGGEEDSDNNE